MMPLPILRPMTIFDADFMLKLKNDKDTRRFSILSTKRISKRNHYAWIKDKLYQFWIIMLNGSRVGAIRMYDSEVSIWIDKPHRKKKIATEILSYVYMKGMTAKIVDGNIASMRAFIKAGFMPIKYVDNTDLPYENSYYIFKK